MKTLKTSAVILFLFSSILIAQSAQAQDGRRMGIKGGLNATNIYQNDINDENARFGFNLGLYGQILSSEVFAIQPELLYSTKGAKWDYAGAGLNQSIDLNINYLDLPVLAVFKLGETAEIHAGPYVGYLLSAKVKYDGDLANGTDDINRDDLNTIDYGLAGGLGLNFGAMQVGARYNYGLAKIASSNAAKDVLGDSKNSNAQLYVAFNLGGNK